MKPCSRNPNRARNPNPNLKLWTIGVHEDTRKLVVEYKGAHLDDNTNERAKHDIGAKSEATSNGSALFLWAVRKDSAGRNVAGQLKAKRS